MFIGEYHHTIDEKGRIIIPAKFRDELGTQFIVTRGIENCLFVYSLENWANITNKLNALPFTKRDARTFNRFFMSGATNVELDKQGRININTPLVDYAKLIKDCVVIGTGDRLEIWSKELWDSFFDSTKDSMSDIAENLFNESVDL
ncbi:MAG: division/cell wall cluster transcriptional repressor MraZ [Bacilli bacterium]|nr:division/cell wall cluster transcriptional repressor MraZ [Bacilli bacterium]